MVERQVTAREGLDAYSRRGIPGLDVGLVRHAADLVDAVPGAIAGRTASSETSDELRDLVDRIDALLPSATNFE